MRSASSILLVAALALVASASRTRADEPVEPTAGSTITRSTRFKPGTYRLADLSGSGALRVSGDDLVLDFTGVVLDGAAEGAAADAFTGTGIFAEKCRRLTVKNLTVRGYKVGMRLVGCDELTLTGCDVSGNYRQHLKSTPRAEDLGDWLSAHENDANQWLRYGAGIYVERSAKATISKNRARRGQNGLCLVRVDDSTITDNDFSFLSGWGLALWRSSRNDVSNNKLDWCIRGFSHDVYHRGQDSAGILVYEQCCDNVFAYNSATHGGDGFFLYAGNEVLERTGEGGCNGNLVFENDFSHAAANGIEATFSERNVFAENRLEECDHGVWAGYSSRTTVWKNSFKRCNHGVSIEHGHDNRIESNTFEKCGVAINLWADDAPDFAKKPFGKKRDLGSHDYTIVRNVLRETSPEWRVTNTKNVLTDESKVPAFEMTYPKTKGTQDAFLPAGAKRGYEWIFVDDWGPYDFSTLRVFPDKVEGSGSAEVWAVGPGGTFTVADVPDGVRVEPASGSLPAKLVVSGAKSGAFRFVVKSGADSAAVSGFLVHATWDVKWFRWDDAGPQKPPRDWEKVIAAKPLLERTVERLDFGWGMDAPGPGVPADHFATLATATIELPAGRYELATVSDDGVRVFVDGAKAIDDWTWHGATEDKKELELTAGAHTFHVEHFEIDGAAELRFSLRPRPGKTFR